MTIQHVFGFELKTVYEVQPSKYKNPIPNAYRILLRPLDWTLENSLQSCLSKPESQISMSVIGLNDKNEVGNVLEFTFHVQISLKCVSSC